MRWIELHKDFCLVVAALIAPFAAVFVALVSSKRQAGALLEATRMQIHAAAFREYRQRNIEKLREELAAHIFVVSELRFYQQTLGLTNSEGQRRIKEGQAQKIRISMLVRAATDHWRQCIEFQNKLLDRIMSAPPQKAWSEKENQEFNDQLNVLGALCARIVEEEEKAAAEK